jgi:glycosyltransferase involved in cell wall biosynthesis
MNVLILTYFFHPEATPRAFRAYELAKELARRGHSVTVYTADNGLRPDYSAQRIDVRHVPKGFLLNRNRRPSNAPSVAAATFGGARGESRLRRGLRALLQMVYLGGFTFEYAFTLFRRLLRDAPRDADLIISIGLPVSVHLGCRLFASWGRTKAVLVADYGDPFHHNASGTLFRHYAAVERWMLRVFDFVSIPIDSARPVYRNVVEDQKIVVIPQGVDFSIARREAYAPGDIVRFCYSGVFYKSIRNPSVLLEDLAARTVPFEFTIYTDFSNRESMELLAPYRERLGSRLILKDLIAREDCIRAMSRFDFLVNQRNSVGFQSASKLIDYGLAGRPVFSFEQDSYRSEVLGRFLARDFSQALSVDLSPFEVGNVAASFERLAARDLPG